MRYSLGTGHGGTQQNMTTSYKTLAALTAATGATTLRRGFIYEMKFGADGTPGDNAMVYKADRQTTVGTGTAAVPSPLDAGDAAALLVGTVNHTAEPTVTAATLLDEMAIHQRASYLWQAAPGSELIVPATNVAGIGLRGKSPAYTSTAQAHLKYWE